MARSNARPGGFRKRHPAYDPRILPVSVNLLGVKSRKL
jgi:hypothetical protein